MGGAGCWQRGRAAAAGRYANTCANQLGAATRSPSTVAPATTAGAGPTMVGQILLVNPETARITLTRSTPPDTISATSTTLIQSANGQARSLTDLKPGQLIQVEGALGDATGAIAAQRIRMLDPATLISVRGLVATVRQAEGVLFLQPPALGFSRLELSAGAELPGADGQPTLLPNVTSGTQIVASGVAGAPGTLLVDSVVVVGSQPTATGTPGRTN